MANQPKDTTWDLDPHTEGKHRVLAQYLAAWIPILGHSRGRIVFIDGFAGPGKYSGGEDGSPLIALKSVLNHPNRGSITAEIVFLFIEERQDRADHLRAEVARFVLPSQPSISIQVECGTFADNVNQVLDHLDVSGNTLAPSFVMIDPFGVSGLPMEIVARILAHPGTEVMVSFMVSYINRFRGHANFEKHLDDLFGCGDWRQMIDAPDSEERVEFFYRLYETQLRRAGAQHVIRVELRRENALAYAIFFATQHSKGCTKMKEGLWRVFKSTDFTYRGRAGDDEPSLDLVFDNTAPLRRELQRRFGGTWVTIEELVRFMESDATLFHPGHLKQKTLKPMEAEGLVQLKVPDGVKRAKGSYPAGSMVLISPA